MKVTIVTVSYNSAATIADTLHSVSEQRYSDIEHIVVDGGSSDDTISLVRRHGKRVTKVISEPDCGIYDAMNKGWRLASGDLIGFLNSDDIFANELVVEKIASTFNDRNVDACYGDLVYVTREDVRRIVRYWKSKAFAPGLVRKGWQPPHPTLYVRREFVQKMGGFDLAYRIQSDFEFCVRLFEVYRAQSFYIPEILVKMRVGGLSNKSWQNVLKGNVEAYRACRKN